MVVRYIFATADSRSYVEVLHIMQKEASDKIVEVVRLKYSSKKEDLERLRKAYVGKVRRLGSAYNIQTHFDMEMLFAIKVSPMEGNVCLLEEMDEGFVEDLIKEGVS